MKKIGMSAALMDGASLSFSGVVNVEGLKNPIELARRLNSQSSRTLASHGARAKAKKWHLPFRSAFTNGRSEEFEAAKAGKTATIGALAVAVAKNGEYVALTITPFMLRAVATSAEVKVNV